MEGTVMAEEFIMLQKILDMMEYGYICIKQFPKSEKYALATDMKHCMDMILSHAIEAQKRYYKKTTIQELDVEITKLRAYIRLSYRLRFLPMEKYENWSNLCVELGKMLGGWLKTVNGQKSVQQRE